jgi:hypothetical protein
VKLLFFWIVHKVPDDHGVVEERNVSQGVMFIFVIVFMAIWIAVSQEAVKPSKEINWRKMITLLSGGSLSVFVITFMLIQSPLI